MLTSDNMRQGYFFSKCGRNYYKHNKGVYAG